jgi:hypothetical protein
MFYNHSGENYKTAGCVSALTLGAATWLLSSVGDDGDHLCKYDKKTIIKKS